MARRNLTFTLTGLCVLICHVWAELEVNTEDKVEVFVGDMALISCQYDISETDSSPMIQWFVMLPSNNNKRIRIYYKDNNTEIKDQGTEYTERIMVDNKVGSSVLTIPKVQVTDEQTFLCHVRRDADSKEGSTRLLVYNKPSPPTIKAASYATAASFSQVATCEVRNAYPVPIITWYKNRFPLQNAVNDVAVHNIKTTNPSGLFTLESKLILTVQQEDKDAKFYCEVTYSVPGAERMMESSRIELEVHYPTTKIVVSQYSPKGLVKEGDTVEIRCQGDGNPPPVLTFTFEENDLGTGDESLILENVTRNTSGTYHCLALEDYVSETIDLMVHYLDPVVIIPEEPDALEGSDLSLSCNALSSLSTTAVWYKDGVQLKEGNILMIHNASYDEAGTYVCEVNASDLPELRRQNSVSVSVRGKPVITEGVTVTAAGPDKSVNLSCRASGHPTPTISWELSDQQAKVSTWSTKTESGVLSFVSIRSKSDITTTCLATNELGKTSNSRNISSMELRSTTTTTTTTSISTKAPGTVNPPKKNRKGGSGVVIAVIIILILVLAILGSVLYFLYKRGRIPCGRSGKQDLTKEKSSKDDFVVEMKSGKSEEAVLLQGVNGDKKAPNNQ